MNWKFCQKPKPVKPEPKRFEIPADKVQEIRRLSDAYSALPSNQDREAHFILCSAIVEIFPELKDCWWRLTFPDGLRAEVFEIIEA